MFLFLKYVYNVKVILVVCKHEHNSLERIQVKDIKRRCYAYGIKIGEVIYWDVTWNGHYRNAAGVNNLCSHTANKVMLFLLFYASVHYHKQNVVFLSIFKDFTLRHTLFQNYLIFYVRQTTLLLHLLYSV